MIRLLNWLLTPWGLVLINGRVIDDLIATSRRFDVERIQQLTRDVQDARDWALLHLLEELGPRVEPMLRAMKTH